MKTKTTQIKRHGATIRIAPGLTATEGQDGNLNTLIIRQRGKVVKSYRGSSLVFGNPLTAEDRMYLLGLCP